MEANAIAAFVASVLGSIGLLIAGLRYIIKLENLPLISRLDKLESTLELVLREKVAKGGKKVATASELAELGNTISPYFPENKDFTTSEKPENGGSPGART